MKKYLKPLLEKTIGTVNAFPCGMTDTNAVTSLIRDLHPLRTEFPLIRLGPKGDGGYLVPDDLIGVSACYSPGVNTVSGFEKDCAELGMKVFLADKSVDGPAENHPLFQFRKRYVGSLSNDEFMTMDSWVSDTSMSSDSDLLLQIDIEGHEYEVFLCISDTLLKRFRIIVAEFHFLDQLWNRPFFSLAEKAFRKILQTHSCVHIHPNNCDGVTAINGLTVPRLTEFTFLRKDRFEFKGFASQFPHPLDFNNTANATLFLPKCWYRG